MSRSRQGQEMAAARTNSRQGYWLERGYVFEALGYKVKKPPNSPNRDRRSKWDHGDKRIDKSFSITIFH